ncbi:hypothetical protein [Pseudonocardia asaccharolytica]|uniref:Signal transduction histidine kinase subgroup 3 dimerisation and phosphoacceptor domain-containing protein n=1 Tax=Pseudonocardia asaccharolytica DSM 44247 = NBRC 16224 TaxID=1123024 RepID=A0A511CXH3_9PSEU|nr:hypothetical protein [Pseudonocardia asaccharolytica]GEL16963.1 hypothetical protein PA7_08000 [Pseudonocardia asaccharolytica DSM 44247 = NBRC 16224]
MSGQRRPPGAEPGAASVAAGHGITGMRERVRAEGGELTVGPTHDGLFTVEARPPTRMAG